MRKLFKITPSHFDILATILVGAMAVTMLAGIPDRGILPTLAVFCIVMSRTNAMNKMNPRFMRWLRIGFPIWAFGMFLINYNDLKALDPMAFIALTILVVTGVSILTAGRGRDAE
ncbi:hypothetical protein ACEUZ9_005470 [Paracoccus litorisediminis]|uniref:hypothetical protein n=1 Tax=Paracoccus litorisediminis TaxID=2006130 RepID=UPI0037302E67